MPKKSPFTKETLIEHPSFKDLPGELIKCFFFLFDTRQLSSTGSFKRVPNDYLLFHSMRWIQVRNEYKADPGCLTQGKFSLQMEKERQSRATDAEDEAYKYFPPYEYKPFGDCWWEALNENGQKEFYFENVVRICKYLVYQADWQGYLVIQNWAQLPEHIRYVNQDKLSELIALTKTKTPVATPRHANRGSSSRATASARPHQQASHPYNDARPKKPKQKKGELAHLGPRVPGGPEQTLESPDPRPQGAVAPVYTEVEIPLGAPPDIVEQINISEGSIPQNASIVWDYTTPDYISAPSPHTTVAQPAPVHDFIYQQPHPAYSPPTWSTTASGSSLTSNVLPTIPLQTELTSNPYGASHSNYPSYNFTAQSNMVASTASGLTLPPHGQMPVVDYIPTYFSSHAWGADYSTGPCYGYGAVDDYSMPIDIDAQYSWPPVQLNHTAPHLQTTFDSNPVVQMSQELQEYFDRTLHEHGGSWTS